MCENPSAAATCAVRDIFSVLKLPRAPELRWAFKSWLCHERLQINEWYGALVF